MNGQPVRELQEMLQFLSYDDPNMPQIIPDGKFGERTLESVMIFQRDHHLPVTGKVDYATWTAIRAAWQSAYRQMGAPASLQVMCNGRFSLREPDRIPPVQVIQAMFDELAAEFSNFKSCEVNGTYHSHTVENTRELQRLSGLERTGVLDRAAWCALAHLYQLFITRKEAS